MAGAGVLEFSGGTRHELPKETTEVVSPLVKVSGHGVVTVAGGHASFGRGVTVVVSMLPLAWRRRVNGGMASTHTRYIYSTVVSLRARGLPHEQP